MKRIVLTGGGSAGHVYPALAVSQYLGKDYQVHFIGGTGIEKEIVAQESKIAFHQISTVKLERKLTAKNLLIPIKLYKSVKEAKKVLKEINPNIIFSKGGFVSLPTVLAGASLGIPVVSHESDMSMGLANKIILKRCTIMCTAFKQTAKKKNCIFTGQPIRKEVFNGKKANILQMAEFDNALPNLLVIGGSLGAKFINEKVWDNIDILTKKFNVVHIAGKKAERHLKHKNYLQVDYAQNIGDFYAFANICISRAGSGVINELLALKIPALLIPLSKSCSRGDQIENAKYFKQQGIADMLLEEEFDKNIFLQKLDNLIKNKEKIKKNMVLTQNFNACEKIVDIIHKLERTSPIT